MTSRPAASLTRLVRAASCCTFVVALAACTAGNRAASTALAPTTEGTANADPAGARRSRVVPPRMLSRRTPELQLPAGSARAARTPLDLRIEVLVDENGRPDMATLRVTGNGATQNREAIARWIASSDFQPATQDGNAVAATFRTSIQGRLRRG